MALYVKTPFLVYLFLLLSFIGSVYYILKQIGYVD